MHYRLLGRTGLYVSELCLGTMTFGGTDGIWKAVGSLDQQAATGLVKQAFDAGVNFIDTANVYASGVSETMTGQAVKSLGLPRDELVIATKATGVMDERSVNARGQSRFHLMNALDASLRRLQLDHVDLYQLHGFDPLTPLDEVLCTLDALVRSGKVRALGMTGAKRSSLMPEVPTVAEAGLPGYQFDVWYGLFAPAKLPRSRLARINADTNPSVQVVLPTC